MALLAAEIRTDLPVFDERSAARRTLRLEVPTLSSRDATEALIHNLSETGLLLETPAGLQVGEALQVVLPHAGTTTAIVVWNRGQFFGCEFASPVSKAAVSAALLLASPLLASPLPTKSLHTARQLPQPIASYDSLESDPGSDSQVALMISLFVALLIAVVLVIALLTFPFSI